MQNKGVFEAFLHGITPSKAKSIGTSESGFFSQWGWNAGKTYSGEAVTVDTALQNDTVWACVRLISEAVATLPLGLYKKNADGSRDFAGDHPLYEILHHQPSASMSAVTFWQIMVASMQLWGNAYAEIIRATRGRIVSLEFLRPETVIPKKDAFGELYYEVTQGGSVRSISKEDMFHAKAFSLDGETGLSAIQYGRNTIGSAVAADKASDETFRDSSRANGIVTMDSVLKPEQRDQVRSHIKRVSAEGGVYVLEKGAGYTPLNFNPVDAELLGSRSFSVETICRWFRVPPVMIGHGDKQSSWPTSTEAQGALFLRYVLRGILSSIEQEIRRSLLTPSERITIAAEFAIEGLLRGDSAARAAFYSTMVQNGIYTRDECRIKENLPPHGGNAALLTVQVNMAPVDAIGQEAVPTEGKL